MLLVKEIRCADTLGEEHAQPDAGDDVRLLDHVVHVVGHQRTGRHGSRHRRPPRVAAACARRGGRLLDASRRTTPANRRTSTTRSVRDPDRRGTRRAEPGVRGLRGPGRPDRCRLGAWWPSPPIAPAGAPNVIVMLVDDLGFSDLGCYGSEIATPNLDALAGGGLRYTNFHVTPMCSPTRAALLTGLNPHRAGVGHVAHCDPGFPGYAMELAERRGHRWPRSSATTATPRSMVGKWHLTKDSRLLRRRAPRLVAVCSGASTATTGSSTASRTSTTRTGWCEDNHAGRGRPVPRRLLLHRRPHRPGHRR